MKCEKMTEDGIVDGYRAYDKCGGNLEYLMSGKDIVTENGVKTPMLYKCSRCGDVTVKS